MASTVTNSVSRTVPRVIDPPKKNKSTVIAVKAETDNDVIIQELFTKLGNTAATYTLEGATFLTLQVQDPIQNKNNVIKIINSSGYMHEVTGTMANIFSQDNMVYSKLEFNSEAGSYITLMSDGNSYNILEVSGKINYE